MECFCTPVNKCGTNAVKKEMVITYIRPGYIFMWQLVVEVVAIDMHMILVLGHIFVNFVYKQFGNIPCQELMMKLSILTGTPPLLNRNIDEAWQL